MTNQDNIIPFEQKTPQPTPPKIPTEPAFNIPPTIKMLAAINIAVFLVGEYLLPVDYFAPLAFIPARYFGDMAFNFYAIVAPITHLFIHGGWLHLMMNMGMLLAFGSGIEKALGRDRLLILYFVSGMAGALCHLALSPTSEIPMVGASGAISGLFGAVLMMLQQQGLLGSGYKKLMPFIWLWVATTLLFGWLGMPGSSSSIAWATHLGGFFAGLLLYKSLKISNTP